MNTALKHWREAATLILAAGHRLGADTLSSRTPLSVSPPSESSSARAHLPLSSRFDYDVLLLKRSAKSGFMPNAYVFPGGALDSSDFSSDWLDVFKSFSNSPNFGLRESKQPVETRPAIFATDRLKLGSPIPGEVALRICALRETFEESGVLLVVPKTEVISLENAYYSKPYKAPPFSVSELSQWRTLVNQNPTNFIRMCRELEVLPNIWALHEWGNWLTPVARYGRRFDTAFFLCCLQETPHTIQDEKEIVHFQWSTPSEILQSYQQRQMWIAPPQFYELSRMCCLPRLDDLHSFAYQRAIEGCEQWLPVTLLENEHYISLLPGDKQYPPDTSGQTKADRTPNHEQKNPENRSALHRMMVKDSYTTTLHVTIKPKYKHLLPVMEPSSSQGTKSQL
ncbi:Nucleoside diphosphate-linked moiety X motif 19, mitochondrial [Oryzias melastigma]|uniref:Acyl-coenzyme A diphosphatase NUDT19 n=1 Tax=Oryzias melastigma TaxID=30732 RepID=A0A834CQZ5_ORYME|nr:Nucleoside diphosphate-linked moiety X motif 19, mitochondrial [Oryzias melastigma]